MISDRMIAATIPSPMSSAGRTGTSNDTMATAIA